ncbi:MAG: hypothetical protein WC365_01185 [Candidatus Babeliales bacterium]|jgi:hypothetical protein
MRIVYDIDGTVDLNLWGAWTHQPTGRRFLNPCVNPVKVKYVITGRPETRRELTLAHLKELGVTPKVLLMNPLGITEPKYLYMMKANYLRVLLADVYVDDDPMWTKNLPKYWDGIVCNTTELGRYV